MRPIAIPVFAALVAATVLSAPAGAQPATTRTPNLEGTWTPPAGMGLFAFLHRFQLLGGGAVVQNIPTFQLSGGLTDGFAAGALYATQTDGKLSLSHELQVFLAQRLLDEEAGAPLSLTLREALHTNFLSPDVDVNLARHWGPVTLHGTARLLGRYRGGATPRVSTGVGASWALWPGLRLAADAAYAVVNPAPAAPDEPPVVWGAGLQMNVPNSPHTLSLQVSNAASASLHGAATASSSLRYGFDFTVPFSGPRRPAMSVGTAVVDGAGQPSPAGDPAATAGRALYEARCASCHGAQGQGAFGPALRGVAAKGDAFIAKRIAEGSPKGMPPFAGALTAPEIATLVTFVKGL